MRLICFKIGLHQIIRHFVIHGLNVIHPCLIDIDTSPVALHLFQRRQHTVRRLYSVGHRYVATIK